MISCGEALEIAVRSSSLAADQSLVGDIVVEPKVASYAVTLVSVIRSNKDFSVSHYAERIVCARDRGRVMSKEVLDISKLVFELPPIPNQFRAISALDAYQRSAAELRGKDFYDKQGRLTVILKPDHYEVSFPTQEPPSTGRGPDYEFQIWVDAFDGKILQRYMAN